MYITLGLLWLSFICIHGALMQCPIGGVTNIGLCEELITESVLQKCYLSSLNTTIKNKNNFLLDETVYEEIETYTDEKKSIKYADIISNIKIKLNITTPPGVRYLTCRCSLALNENDTIETLWDGALTKSTDTYILKLHNQLLNKYKNKPEEEQLSSKECMILIQSYYNAASTLYFAKHSEAAYIVISDGLDFFNSIKDQLLNDDSINEQDINVWLVLCLTLKMDILNAIIYVTDANEILSSLELILLEEEIKLDSPEFGFLPSSAALLYRKYFLDTDPNEYKKNKLDVWLKTNFLKFEDEDDYMNIYSLLILSMSHTEDDFGKTNFEYLMKAIIKPVLSTEDRLLNYKATELALEKVKICIDENGWKFEESIYPFCNQLNIDRNTNSILDKTILPKLTSMHYTSMENVNLIMQLKDNLTDNCQNIDENVLHLIVTTAIDIDYTSEKYQKKIEIAKQAMKVLQRFIFRQLNEVKENKKQISTVEENTIENNENEIEETNDDNEESSNTINNENNNDYEDETNDIPNAVTEYTPDQGTRLKNVILAFKWLAELNGLLCMNSQPYIKLYQKELSRSLRKAVELKNKRDFDDDRLLPVEDHLQFLINKKKCKELVGLKKWENSTKPDGWILNGTNIFLVWSKKAFTDIESECISQMLNQIHSDSPFFNIIEVYTLLFRLHWMKGDHETAKSFIESALYIPVITSEDRVRNLEAHELYSMFLMERNIAAINKNDNDFENGTDQET